jgi:hypothetical protein
MFHPIGVSQTRAAFCHVLFDHIFNHANREKENTVYPFEDEADGET